LLIGAIWGLPKKAMALKSKGKREIILQEISFEFPNIISPLEAVLNALGEDIRNRNTHTHETFLEIGLATNGDGLLPILTS
jgi:hypothetical protein